MLGAPSTRATKKLFAAIDAVVAGCGCLTTGLELGNICRELSTSSGAGPTAPDARPSVHGCPLRGRAAGDQGRVDPIILGMLQHELGVSTNLHRLEDDDVKAGCPQGGNHRLFVTPARLDTDCSTPHRRTKPTRLDGSRRCYDLQPFRAALDRDVQLVFAVSMRRTHAILPSSSTFVMRTSVFK